MVGSVLVSGSFIAAGSSSLSAVGSGIMPVQRGGGLLLGFGSGSVVVVGEDIDKGNAKSKQ